jgi:hypothetical protein
LNNAGYEPIAVNEHEKRIDRSSVVNNLRRGDIKLAKAME